jgi:hypothetical protein
MEMVFAGLFALIFAVGMVSSVVVVLLDRHKLVKELEECHNRIMAGHWEDWANDRAQRNRMRLAAMQSFGKDGSQLVE